jgi:hypothetical protein
MLGAGGLRRILTAALVLGASSGALAADDGGWSVSKSSGEVWIATTGADQVSLRQEEVLKPGDTIRTGRNGRVLLVRGEETILIAPNSVVGLPVEKTDGLPTTILQQAGSILLDVEKRNVKHFEVETPYLAAVVKGTQFRVTVNAANTSVEVSRGQVEVSDFKSGQIAQVLPGQAATASAHGKTGLTLSGSGAFFPIEQGRPRASSIDRVPVPRDGLHAPHSAANGKLIHALGTVDTTSGKPAAAPLRERQAKGNSLAKRNVIRISASLGEVTLNVQKATHGLARGSVAPGSPKNSSSKDTVWSDAKASVSSASTGGQGNSTSSGNAATAATTVTTNGAATSAATASTIAAVTVSANNSGSGNSSGATGSGKGNSGNGNNGNGNGNNGNGNGNGNGNSGNGNGNGNGNSNGNGNGNGNGKTK